MHCILIKQDRLNDIRNKTFRLYMPLFIITLKHTINVEIKMNDTNHNKLVILDSINLSLLSPKVLVTTDYTIQYVYN